MKIINKFGIDFGTTNSSIALTFLGDDGCERTEVIDLYKKSEKSHNRGIMPTVIYIDEDGSIEVGVKAIQCARTRNGRLIRKIKMDLEEKGENLRYRVNEDDPASRVFEGIDLIAAVFAFLLQKGEAYAADATENGVDIQGVVCGVPVRYGDIQKTCIKKALVKAGFYKSYSEADQLTEFVSEPVAVAVHYGEDLTKDKTVMVFDFGGGTLDVAIVNLKNQVSKFDKLHPHETLAKDRLTLGGEDLDRLLFLKCICKQYGFSNLCRIFGKTEANTPEELWERIITDPDYFDFVDKLDECKCALSNNQKVTFNYSFSGGVLENKTIYRSDFENAIKPELSRIRTLIDGCLETAGIEDPYDISDVLLAGGSSLIPKVQDLLQKRFGVQNVKTKSQEYELEDTVMDSIVRGLSKIGCTEVPLVDDVVDSDYGIWDDEENCFLPIIRRGIKVKDTMIDRISGTGKYTDVKTQTRSQKEAVIQVYQNSIKGYERLGKIHLNKKNGNFLGSHYRVYMTIDPNQGLLRVEIFAKDTLSWISIPSDEREYQIQK